MDFMKPDTFFKPLFLLFAVLFISFSSVAREFYVSPAGNDSHPGNVDQPYKTVVKALQAAVSFLAENQQEDCIIWFENGEYPIKEPLVFRSINTRQGNHLSLKALPGAKPVISGGVNLENWEQMADGIWKASLPEMVRKNINPRELFIGSTRCTRARYPNEGYLKVEKVGSDRRTHFYFKKGDFPVPQNAAGTELVLLHDWSISRIGVKDINTTEHKLTAVDSIGAKNPAFFNLDHWEAQPRYFLENAPEFLDADYEWYYNPEEKAVYLKLPPSVIPSAQKIIIPVSEGLVVLEGEENNPVNNIHFEGIQFLHSAWSIPEQGYCGVQACHYDPRPLREGWNVVPAAITAVWAENCSFTSCSFGNLGGSGLWFGTGSSNCKVTGSDFYDISGNGIMIGEGQDRLVNSDQWWKSAPEQVAVGNMIENCRITKCGAQFSGAVGIWAGLTAETIIRNNTIFELPYTGISMGWMWSPEPTPSRANVIEGNHIHHIMQVLSDGGGIYMLGLQPGSRIVNNHIHNVSINAGRAESNGMFLDEGTTGVVVEGNLIYHIAKSPLRFHRATVNLVKDNILFCGEDTPPVRYNNTKEADIRLQNNTIYSEYEDDFHATIQKVLLEWKHLK
jgi:hypothetical protein